MGALRLEVHRDGVHLVGFDDFAVPPAVPLEPHHDWFLTAYQRGNRSTRLRTWTQGNAVRPLVHGRPYFAALADEVDLMRAGDAVLLAGWRVDPDEFVRDDGTTIAQLLAEAAQRGVTVKGLVWRSQMDRMRFSRRQNRRFAEFVNAAGGEVLLDQRVRPFGSHHQKFVVLRHAGRPEEDVVFLGGIDVAHSRRDDIAHRGDPQRMPYARWYGGKRAWHDVQIEVRGPAVRDVEDVFRERWGDPAALSRRPWHLVPHLLDLPERRPSPLPEAQPDPPAPGTCSVQLLRTYPNRWGGYPFAPHGERSIARGYAKALRRAQRLVYIEDQYLWSTSVARVFAEALLREPRLHLVVVVPRFPDQETEVTLPVALLAHTQALDVVKEAGGDRVLVLDLESPAGNPVYVHSKVCVVDDVWATVGSDNFNRRSWTHDSELTAAVVDEERDPREPLDPAGTGDGARVFARSLRLELWREHLDLADDTGLLDPDDAVATLRRSVTALDAWYAGGRPGPRPPGRLRTHVMVAPTRWQRRIASPAYRAFVDPDGRPPRMKVRGHH
ncbi:phosphatidylserine/phosphatidylglycerophosphate/cardiolipin synthase family protein [Actinotalea sp. K2]|uniref:phospholipase D-like domain-containing protein n=1 Tax=Actinotalea sp. K2 TaxID=2939438 RepID=UPI0020173A1B|nr:phospholipase D family protein [Actinotalea sp. K2]MCL3862977.1 phospholipase D family protein [Actinotalea sp. K2]